MANLQVCLVGLTACGGAHHWVRIFTEMEHTVRMMAPQFVKPYVKSNKNDAVDAEVICEAVQRPNMRFVPSKSIEQTGDSEYTSHSQPAGCQTNGSGKPDT